MDYSILINDVIYKLEAFTLDLADSLMKAKITNNRTLKQCVRLKYDFIKEVCKDLELPAFAEVDPNFIQIVFEQIDEAYNKPLIESKSNTIESNMEAFNMTKMLEIVSALEKINKLK